MEKKKLLVTASTFPRWEADTEPRFVLDISKELNKYYDVTVLVPAAIGAKDEEVLEGVKVVRYHYFPIHRLETLCYPGAIVPRIKEKKARILLVPFLFIALFIKLSRMVSKFDAVHVHWLIPQGIVQSFFKKPYIVTGHGGDVTSLNKGIIKKLKKRCIKNASYVTAVSSKLLEVMEQIQEHERNAVISMGCKTSHFGERFRVQDFFHQKDKKVILFVGRLAEKKGVSYLIEAMEQVDAKLVIVGSGSLEEELKKQTNAINQKYPNRIEFIGPKTHEELKTIYASADIFCAPSVVAKDGDMEGLGLVKIEAMASGLPVVATCISGEKDLITDGVDGLFVKEKDARDIAKKLNMLLNDEALYAKIKENGYKTAQEYDYEVLGKKYHEVLQEII